MNVTKRPGFTYTEQDLPPELFAMSLLRFFDLLSLRAPALVLSTVTLSCLLFPGRLLSATAKIAKPGVPGYVVVPLGRGHNNRLLLTATIEGTKGLMIVDTGASGTLLSSARYGALLKDSNRKLPAGVPQTISMNGVQSPVTITHGYVVNGHDLGPVAAVVVPPRLVYDQAALYDHDAGRQYDGLVGEDLLRRCRAVVDCAHLVLYLNVDPARPLHLAGELERAGWTRIPMAGLKGGDFTVPCEVNGHAFRLIVDTGAPLTMLDRDRIRGAGVGARDLPMKAGVIGTRGEEVALADTRTLHIGAYTLGSTYLMASPRAAEVFDPAAGAGTPLLGFLGGDVLAKNSAFIDIGEQALYLKHSSVKQP